VKLEVGKIAFDNVTREKCISTDWMKSGDDYSNLDHNSGIGHYIESDKINPAYLIGSCYLQPGWRYPSQKRSRYKMDSY